MNFLLVLIIFSVLIIAHEFGHFIAARRAGIKVEKFSIGFGPVLFKKQGKETQFLICVFPLGGYVKLAGDSRPEHKGLKHEFLSKPIGTRMQVVFAGPLFNYLLALVLFWIIAAAGFPYIDTIVGGVLEDYPAEAAGVKTGDKVLAVNGVAVENWNEMTTIIQKAEEKVELKIIREGEQLVLDIPLEEKEITDAFGRKENVPMIGIAASANIKTVKYGFPQAIGKGFEALFSSTVLLLKGLVLIVRGVIPFKDAVSGPVGIYYYASEAIKVGIVATLYLMAVLNVTLAIINLFPIPILDGGHLLFCSLEKVR